MIEVIALWLRTVRVKTLTAAAIPIFVMHAWAGDQAHGWITLMALLSGVGIQIGTNLFNDLKDFDSGIDTASRIGPRRALLEGRVSRRQFILLTHSSFVFATLAGIPLVLAGGLPILVVGVLSLLLGYSYTAGPLNLSRHGCAEPFVVFFFGIIPCAALSWLHLRVVSPEVMLLGAGLGGLATVLLVINNLRDRVSDEYGGRRTLAVRYGDRFARGEVIVFLLSGIFFLGMVLRSYLMLMPLFLSGLIIVRIMKGESGAGLNRLLGQAGMVHLISGIVACIVLWSRM